MDPGGPRKERTGLRGGGARPKPEDERPRAQNPPPPLCRRWTKPRLGLRYLRLPSPRRTLGADAQFSHLPLSSTPSSFYSCSLLSRAVLPAFPLTSVSPQPGSQTSLP